MVVLVWCSYEARAVLVGAQYSQVLLSGMCGASEGGPV